MDYHLSITKLVLATIPLWGQPVGIAILESRIAEADATVDTGIGHCEQFPYSVHCDRNVNTGDGYQCYATLCAAEAAGAYHCKKKFKGTCEPQLANPTGPFFAEPRGQ